SVPAALPKDEVVVTGDFNNDGNLDFVIANQGGSAMATFMRGNGDGTFTKGNAYSAGAYPQAAAVADFNGDGNLDIAFADSSTYGVTILLGNGDGTFTAAAKPAVGYAAGIVVGDFNGDGIADLAVANSASGNQVTILFGKGDGTFITGPSTAVPQWSVSPLGLV